MKNFQKALLLTVAVLLFLIPASRAGENGKPLVLQEMSWPDVAAYLQTSDMVIIPIGSTEQHGPHLPLGTDFYEAMGMCRRISARTKVVVAPVVMAGYSLYHSGFPGSLSLKPGTLEAVLFETSEMLIKYGFRRFMFFNYHGGNRIVEETVIQRLNHETAAVAVSIGVGSPIQTNLVPEKAPFDHHAGIGETSIMLALEPDLVKMERAAKPEMTFTPAMQELQALGRQYPGLMMVFSSMLGVPSETGKGGASHELSSNGIWSMGDPAEAGAKLGEMIVSRYVDNAVLFIEAWKKSVKKP